VSEAILSFFGDQVISSAMFIIFSLALFLFLGTFMDAIPAIVLFVPVIMPSAMQFGISSIQLGLMIVITMAIGQITPPYGLCLLLAGKIGNLSVGRSFRAALPYLGVVLIVLLLVSFFPSITLAVPKLIKPEWFV
jgi:TRAP-type C4-dicarboxylate transport system permease large subunit